VVSKTARWHAGAVAARRIGPLTVAAVWHDGRTFKARGRPLVGHTGFILMADVSTDDVWSRPARRTVRSASGRRRADDRSAARYGVPNAEVGAAFVLGSTHLAAIYDGGRGYVWDLSPSAWERRACVVAGRPLTRAEWNEALPGRSYEPACAPTER
jgi:hypothetical protein